jgi:alpha-glucosidase
VVQDPRELNEPGLGLGRDPVRTPMPWDGSTNAGFSPAEPWLPLNADWAERNVAAQTTDPVSMLSLHGALLALRREHAALAIGDFLPVECEGDVLAYERRYRDDRLLVALNLGAKEQVFLAPHPVSAVLLSTNNGKASQPLGTKITLAPDEGLILRLE